MFRHKLSKKHFGNLFTEINLLLTAMVVVVSAILALFITKPYLFDVSLLRKDIKPTPAPTIEIISTPTLFPTFSQPTAFPTKRYVNPDPVTTCTSTSPNCVGEPGIKLKRSQCAYITCCQVGSKWTIYASSSQCKKDQASYYNAIYNTGSYVPPNNVFPTYAVPTINVPTIHIDIPTYSPSYPNTDSSGLQGCIDSANASYQSFMNAARAAGAANSSEAQQAEITREQRINQCNTEYGN